MALVVPYQDPDAGLFTLDDLTMNLSDNTTRDAIMDVFKRVGTLDFSEQTL
jgi:hypothetical protein